MAFEKIKRNRFYEPPSPSLPGGFDYPHVSRNHYEDQHELHFPLERVHQSSLHDWGIAAGLGVSGSVGGSTVTVEAGAAVDIKGNLIVLAEDGSGDIGANPEANQHNELETPVTMDLGGQAGSLCYVTIAHSEMIRPAEGSGGRAERVPWVRLQPVSSYVNDGLSVILAVVDIDGSGAIASLGATHGSATHKRRLMDHKTRDIVLQRATKAGETVTEEEAGRLSPGDGGGISLTLPGAGDNFTIQRSGGANIDTMDLRSNYLNVKDSHGRDALRLQSNIAWLTVGANGNEGDIEVKDGSGRRVMHMNGSTAGLDVGSRDNAGDIFVKDKEGRTAFHLRGDNAALYIGATENEGDIVIRDNANRDVITLNGNSAWLKVGEDGNEGDIEVKDHEGRQVMHFNGQHAVLYIGATENEGDIRIRDGRGGESISMSGDSGNIWSNGYSIIGNPARKVRVVWLHAEDGTDYEEVDLGETHQVFAHTVMFGMDPLHRHDAGDAFALDVWRIDGDINPSQYAYGGSQWGPSGSNSAIKSPHYRGLARRIKFRARSFQDATLFGMGIVYWE